MRRTTNIEEKDTSHHLFKLKSRPSLIKLISSIIHHCLLQHLNIITHPTISPTIFIIFICPNIQINIHHHLKSTNNQIPTTSILSNKSRLMINNSANSKQIISKWIRLINSQKISPNSKSIINPTNRNRMNLSNKNRMNLSNRNRMNLSNRNRMNLSNKSRVNLYSNRNRMSLSNRNTVNLSNKSRMNLYSNRNRMSLYSSKSRMSLYSNRNRMSLSNKSRVNLINQLIIVWHLISKYRITIHLNQIVLRIVNSLPYRINRNKWIMKQLTNLMTNSILAYKTNS